LEVFIVRIYRREESDRRQVAGTVEKPGKAATCAFTNLDELRDILIGKGPRRRSAGSSRKE